MPSPIYDSGYRYATQYYTLNGSTTDFEFNFDDGYISKDYVKAFYRKPDLTETEIPRTSIVFIGDNTIRILGITSVSTAWKLVIRRDTPKSIPLVDFTDNSVLNERTLDKSTRQTIHGIAEMVDIVADFILEFRNLNENVFELLENFTELLNVVNILENKISVIENDINNIEASINALSISLATLTGRVDGHDTQINTINNSINTINNSINSINNSISDINNEIDNMSFTNLNDTPESFAGHGGKLTSVKNDESGLEFKTVSEMLSGIEIGGGIDDVTLRSNKAQARKWPTFPANAEPQWQLIQMSDLSDVGYANTTRDEYSLVFNKNTSNFEYKRPGYSSFDLLKCYKTMFGNEPPYEEKINFEFLKGYLNIGGVNTQTPVDSSATSYDYLSFTTQESITYAFDFEPGTYYFGINKSDGKLEHSTSMFDIGNYHVLYKVVVNSSGDYFDYLDKIYDLRELNSSGTSTPSLEDIKSIVYNMNNGEISTRKISATFDGLGDDIQVGSYIDILVPFNGKIIKWEVVSPQKTSMIKFEVLRETNYLAGDDFKQEVSTSAQFMSITGNKPGLNHSYQNPSGGTETSITNTGRNQDTSLGYWEESSVSGLFTASPSLKFDTLVRIKVLECTGCKHASLSLVLKECGPNIVYNTTSRGGINISSLPSGYITYET